MRYCGGVEGTAARGEVGGGSPWHEHAAKS